MKKLWPRYLIIFTLAIFCGAALLHTSQSVQKAESKLRVLKTSLAKERENIRVLNAEWAYLNSPSRLETLAHQHLNLVSPSPDMLMSTPASLPEYIPPVIPSVKPYMMQEAIPISVSSQDQPAAQVSPLPMPNPSSDFSDLLTQTANQATSAEVTP